MEAKIEVDAVDSQMPDTPPPILVAVKPDPNELCSCTNARISGDPHRLCTGCLVTRKMAVCTKYGPCAICTQMPTAWWAKYTKCLTIRRQRMTPAQQVTFDATQQQANKPLRPGMITVPDSEDGASDDEVIIQAHPPVCTHLPRLPGDRHRMCVTCLLDQDEPVCTLLTPCECCVAASPAWWVRYQQEMDFRCAERSPYAQGRISGRQARKRRELEHDALEFQVQLAQVLGIEAADRFEQARRSTQQIRLASVMCYCRDQALAAPLDSPSAGAAGSALAGRDDAARTLRSFAEASSLALNRLDRLVYTDFVRDATAFQRVMDQGQCPAILYDRMHSVHPRPFAPTELLEMIGGYVQGTIEVRTACTPAGAARPSPQERRHDQMEGIWATAPMPTLLIGGGMAPPARAPARREDIARGAPRSPKRPAEAGDRPGLPSSTRARHDSPGPSKTRPETGRPTTRATQSTNARAPRPAPPRRASSTAEGPKEASTGPPTPP